MTGIRVDLASPTPAYEQIRSQVAGLVSVGDLAPGDRLPASRTLAHDLGIAVGTVQRAYRELEQSGVVVSRRRTGTVVAADAALRAGQGGTGAGSGGLVRSARSFVEQARGDGLDDAAILDLVRAVLRDR
ncbi:GntR family transcriptional regulator [Isoptericola dokdonensis]|jgi:GntR family transcriptional regulator|uniref:HTH-type transcriptional repressor YtrA n=1 Tax=Isoptericola dokdonensis DS-3 TaxID=1300344 RepID=A0A161IKD1_9MICO|nr:GntR family transcriptional regulator [Isoptericola dokdonensis]ANC32624.1 HTH-type transcriptional repressor YtrA [Isoptericola dokdonensis DS-3]